MALANWIMSGSTPQCCRPNILPVRPNPVMTSSETSKTSYLSQILADAREVVGLGRDHAAAALHRLGDEHRDRFRPLGEDRLLQLIGRSNPLALRALRRFVAIGIGARDVDEARDARLEHGPVNAHARRAHSSERDTVIAPDAGDDLGLLGPPLQLPIVAGHLDVAVGRLAAARREVEVIDVRVGDPGELFGKLDRSRVGTAGIAGGVGQFGKLLAAGVDEVAAAIAGRVVPEAGEAVDEAIPVRIDEEGPFPADPDLAGGMSGLAVQRMEQVRAISIEQRSFGVVGHFRRSSPFATARLRARPVLAHKCALRGQVRSSDAGAARYSRNCNGRSRSRRKPFGGFSRMGVKVRVVQTDTKPCGDRDAFGR